MQEVIIQNKIYEIRRQKIMLVPIAIGIDLAEIYEVETWVLNQAVKKILVAFQKILCFNSLKKNWNL